MRGIYLLIIDSNYPIEVEVGALGDIGFHEGRYIYVGSAQNGVEKRVERHLRDDKRKHWHIDHLLEEAQVKEVMGYGEKKKGECRTAAILKEKFSPVEDFGCSDCRCDSHLFYSEEDVDSLIEKIRDLKGREDLLLKDVKTQ